ncbi:unnamed protein product [Brassica oleracea var. botrytis]
MNKEFGYFWLSTIKFRRLESYIHVNLRIRNLKCVLLMVLILDILLFTRSKPGEERPGGSCSWILVTLNAEKHNLFDDTLHNWNHSSTNSHIKKQMMEWCGGDHTTSHDYGSSCSDSSASFFPSLRRTDETERIHMRLMNFVMLQELMKQLTNFKSSEAMWRSSVKLGGAEVQSLKTRNGITTSGGKGRETNQS